MNSGALAVPLPRWKVAPWLVVVGWWSVGGLFSAANYHQMAASDGGSATWGHALATALASSYLWVPLTMAIFWCSRRYPLEPGRWRRSLLVLAAGCLLVILLRALVVMALNQWVGWYRVLPPLGSVLVTSVNNNALLYWLIVGVAHAVHYAHRARQQELEASRLTAQLAQARLDALKAQLHPHFLFNTLHALAELVHRDVETADRMIVRLSELLRRALERPADEEVCLREELSFARLYLEIEQMRAGDRLQVDWQVAPEALEARVPQLLLQPLIENAVRHGLARRAAPVRLVVAARVGGGWLSVEVRDNGAGPDAAAVQGRSNGIGLANTRARLRQRYGADHRFALAAAPEGGAVASIEIPLHPHPAGATA